MSDIREMQEKALYKAVKAESSADIASAVVYGEGEAENDPVWVQSAMRRLENRFEAESVKKIRMNCQCGYGMEEKFVLLKELMAKAANIEELVRTERAKAAGLSYKNGQLFLEFHFCPCPMLAQVERLETDTWCQCTTGYSKALFERAFACTVDVELLRSIKMGDTLCLMKITPHDPQFTLPL